MGCVCVCRSRLAVFISIAMVWLVYLSFATIGFDRNLFDLHDFKVYLLTFAFRLTLSWSDLPKLDKLDPGELFFLQVPRYVFTHVASPAKVFFPVRPQETLFQHISFVSLQVRHSSDSWRVHITYTRSQKCLPHLLEATVVDMCSPHPIKFHRVSLVYHKVKTPLSSITALAVV